MDVVDAYFAQLLLPALPPGSINAVWPFPVAIPTRQVHKFGRKEAPNHLVRHILKDALEANA